MNILKSQKKQVYNMITICGLEPSMFEWEVVSSKNDISGTVKVSKLRYINTHYSFIFDFRNDVHYCIFSPGETVLFQEEFPISWNKQLGSLKNWLKYLKRETETIDPWDEIDKYMPGGEINLEDEKENSPYSYEQVEHITKALHRLKDEITKSYNLDDEQDKLVQNKLDYLIDRSKKMGRIDWKNIFVATFLSLAVNLALDPVQTKDLWNMIKICFKGILLLGSG